MGGDDGRTLSVQAAAVASEEACTATGLRVPAVHLAQLWGGAEDARAASRGVLAEAARQGGVARLLLDEAGADLAAAVREAGRDYFDLGLQLKGCDSCSKRDSSRGFQRGYIPFATESGLAAVKEIKEGFCYGFEWPSDREPRHAFQAANVWPQKEAFARLGQSWRHMMMKFFDFSVRAARDVAAALGETLPQNRSDELEALLQDGDTISQMRMFHYLPPPPAPREGERFMGSSPHTDWHVLTLILRDTASQLQYRDKASDEWMNATAGSQSELILLIGDWLSMFSGGEFHSAAHRVTLPESDSSLAFVFFFYPSPDARLPRRGRGLSSHREELNTVDDSMFELSWGEYVVQKWIKVMSNR